MKCTLGEVFRYLSRKYMIDVLHFFRERKEGARYVDIYKYLSSLGASSRTTSMRLNELLRDGILEKNSNKYYLTEKGEELIACLKSLHLWQEKYVVYGDKNGRVGI